MEGNLIRIPPHNLDAEMDILGAMMLDEQSIAVAVDRLGGPEDGQKFFYKLPHGELWKAITSLRAAGKPADFVYLLDYFGESVTKVGGAGYLSDLINSTIGRVRKSSLDMLILKWKQRERLVTAHKVVNSIYKLFELGAGQAEPDVLAETGELMRQDLFRDVAERRGIKAICRDVVAEWEDRINGGGMAGFPMPIMRLNHFTGGWVHSRLYVAGARPGMGKTSFGIQACQGFSGVGNRPAIVTLEMPDTEIVGRNVCQVAKADYSKMQTDPAAFKTRAAWDLIASAMKEMTDSEWVVIDEPGATVDRICAAVENEHYQNPLSFVCVDYLQIVGGLRVESLTQDTAKACDAFKNLARRLKIPVLLLSQLSREVEKRKGSKRPIPSDLRDSGGIEQAADVVMFFYRHAVYDDTMSDDAEKVAEIIIAKNRYGPIGRVLCMFDGPTTRFYEDDATMVEEIWEHRYPDIDREWLTGHGYADASGNALPPKALVRRPNDPLPGDADDMKAMAAKPADDTLATDIEGF